MGEKHTPTPWEACERGDYYDDGVVIIGDDLRVAVVNREEDAAFIVRAVNNHDKLAKALHLVAHSGKFQCFDDAAWDVVNDALASLQTQEEGR